MIDTKVMLNEYRVGAAPVRDAIGEVVGNLEDIYSDTANAMRNIEECRRLAIRAIALLNNPLYEGVLIMHDLEGLGLNEIAKLNGVSYEAIKKRHQRATATLDDLLADMVNPWPGVEEEFKS
jgi:DNA-directed RNA polymerase specialized sigma24 family protein